MVCDIGQYRFSGYLKFEVSNVKAKCYISAFPLIRICMDGNMAVVCRRQPVVG